MAPREPVPVLEIGEEGAGPRLVALADPGDPAGASCEAFWKTFREALVEQELLPIPIGEAERLRIAARLGDAVVWGVGLGRRLGLALVRPRGMRAADALRQVEARAAAAGLGLLPAAWAALFLLLERLGPLPADISEAELLMVGRTLRAFALLLREHPSPDAPRRPERQTPLLRRMETRKRLPLLWAAPGTEDPPRILGGIPMGGVDAALAWIEAGQNLWRPEEIPEETPTLPGFLAAATLAEAAGGAGQGLLAWEVWDWPLWWEVVRARRAGRPLPPSDWGPPQILLLRRSLAQRTLEESLDEAARLAAGLFRALMDVAAREARYVPQGRLRVRADLPPLQARGVAAFRVAADSHGLWLRPVDPEGREGEIFRLDRALPPRPDLAEVDPFWLAAAAALWHDLVVGVPRPSAGRRRSPTPSREPREEEAEAAQTATAPAWERRLVLPRPFRVTAGEGTEEPEAEWGEPEVRRRLAKAAHTVRGHLRRLPEGWKASSEARRFAEGFGLVVPDGFTFVRPHVRGGREKGRAEAIPPEPEAVARGLASLMLLAGPGFDSPISGSGA